MLPPGPTSHPALQIASWIRRPIPFMEECQARYGDTFTVRFPEFDRIVISSEPEVAKDMFAAGPEKAHAGKANVVLKPFLGQHSLLLLDGPEHLRQRKMMMPAFHGDRMHAYGRSMIDLADAEIDRWQQGREFPIHPSLQSITLEVILRTVFGMAEGARQRELASLVASSLDAVASPVLLFKWMQKDLGAWSPWGKFVRKGNRAKEIIVSEIRRGRAEGTKGRTDVLAMMLDARDENGEPMTEDEIHDQLITLVVAGHETTATSLAWAMRWLWASPVLARRLLGEIEDACPDGELVPTTLAKLELLDGVVKETLRLQPVIPMVGRVLQEPMRLGRYDLPAGSAITASIYLIHQRASLYPQPRTFNPDRYKTFKPSASEFLPFGGGIRKCIGAAFAIYEMKMVLAAVLTRVSMRLARTRIRMVRRAITFTPEAGLPVIMTSRRPRERRAMAAELRAAHDPFRIFMSAKSRPTSPISHTAHLSPSTMRHVTTVPTRFSPGFVSMAKTAVFSFSSQRPSTLVKESFLRSTIALSASFVV
jgi:cytochrome P450